MPPRFDLRRCAILAAVLVWLAAPLTVRAATPAPSAPTGCPTGVVTLETLIGLRLEPGLVGHRYEVPTNEAALACYGSTSLRFEAFVASPEGLGGAVSYSVDPPWLDSWGNAGPYLAASDREAMPGAPLGPFFPIAVPPALLAAYEAEHGRWVSVTDRFDAPQAASCATDRPPQPGAVPTTDELVRLCRSSFVLTAIEPASDPCPVDVTLDAILDTPESSRADCFGGQELTFMAAGYAITNTWPGISLPPVLLHDWILRADRREAELTVSVPDTVALPDPSGTPWANRDTVGTSATWWEVTGHFDDAAAGDCRPEPDDTVDGIPVEMSPAEVRTFCRNRLVVDRLVWLPMVDPAGSPFAVKATPGAEGPPIEQGPSIEQAPRPSDADVDSAPTLAIAVVVGLSILVFVIAAFASTRTRGSR